MFVTENFQSRTFCYFETETPRAFGVNFRFLEMSAEINKMSLKVSAFVTYQVLVALLNYCKFYITWLTETRRRVV